MKGTFVFAFVLCLVLLPLSLAIQAIPIPPQRDGYAVGKTGATLQLEMFGDLLCPDTAEVYEKIVKPLNQKMASNDYQFWLHLFPLPYHRNSYDVNRGALCAAEMSGDLFWSFVDYSLANQAKLWNEPTYEKSQDEVTQIIGDWAAQVGLNRGNFLSLMGNSTTDEALRVSWKFACSRGVTGTPYFVLNGVIVNDGYCYPQTIRILM
eukprot:TRINITY_DN1117_c0_g1_i1.p1 TRINITY_DN1117_c0_g1~~TRINITY_DN1117_c0_g1_i1.p1  ORF type:complete len:234 (-),score=38.75 TRINITY_DN1117_c0_g1_i1:68-688(-)